MNIKEDYSYISNNKMKLVNMGYAKIGVHSINFDRYFTEDEMQENHRQSEVLSPGDWGNRCDEFSRKLNKQIDGIMNVLNDKYSMYQFTTEKSKHMSFKGDWDIYFYSNKGWNKKDHYDYVQLSFNEKRSIEENLQLKDDILEIIKTVDNTQNVSVRVQYTVVVDEKKVNESVSGMYEKLLNKMIVNGGLTGKIRVVSDTDGIKKYGFFPKGSKRKYFKIDNADLLLTNSQGIAV